jgi:hypothetical protein
LLRRKGPTAVGNREPFSPGRLVDCRPQLQAVQRFSNSMEVDVLQSEGWPRADTWQGGNRQYQTA